MTPTIIVDLDGTLIERKWPDMGDWMPGAVEAMRTFHKAGMHIKLFSCRLSPYTPYGKPRDPTEVATEIQKVRHKLDSAGLSFIDIWTLPGKPSGAVYIDDKAERYGRNKGSWRAMTEKVLLRLDSYDDDIYPIFRQEGLSESV